MNIRYGKEEDKLKAKKIWKNCFIDSAEEINFYFENIYKKENYFILEENEQILASLHENKYKLKINNDITDSVYIVGVAVLPEYRKRGYMKKLLEANLTDLKAKGYEFIYLSAINSSIYRKFGFEYILDIEENKFSVNEINFNCKLSEYSIIKIEIEEIDNYSNDLIEIYNEKMKSFNLYVDRDSIYYKKLLGEVYSDGGEAYIFYKNFIPQGYIILYRDEGIVVREIFGKNIENIKVMLEFIKSFKDYYKVVEMKTPMLENFNMIFEDQKKIEKKVIPFIMGRILEPIKILKKLINNPKDIKIYLVDDIIKENEGIYYIESSGDISYRKNGEWDVKIDIGNFTALIFGYLSLEFLIFSRNIKFKCEESKKIFEKIFIRNSAYKSYILDYQ